MSGQYETLKKISQNTFSVYIASGSDLQNALIPGLVHAVQGPVTYFSMGHTMPILSVSPDQRYMIDFRKIEGFCGLIGAIKKDKAHLLFIQYSHEHLEDYEKNIHVFADECRNHARHIAPVIILSVSHDSIIEQLGINSDRYIIFTDKKRKTFVGRRIPAQTTLNQCPMPSCLPDTQKQMYRYGQQTLFE